MPRFAVNYGAKPDGHLEPVNPGASTPTDYSEQPAMPSGGGGSVTTAEDYYHFAQMLANGGELAGKRILSPETVKLMSSNHLPPSLLTGQFAGGQHVMRRGFGYGFNVAVVFDPPEAELSDGKGTFFWDGAAGTWFWVDPTNDVVFVCNDPADDFARQPFDRIQKPRSRVWRAHRSVEMSRALPHVFVKPCRTTRAASCLPSFLGAVFFVRAQDSVTITQSELVHRTQALYDAVAPGDKGPWQQYLADDAIIHDEKGGSYTKPTFLATVDPLPPGYSGIIMVTHPQTIFAPGVAIFSYDAEEVETVFGNRMTARYHQRIHGFTATIFGRLPPAKSCVITKILPVAQLAPPFWQIMSARINLLPAIR